MTQIKIFQNKIGCQWGDNAHTRQEWGSKANKEKDKGNAKEKETMTLLRPQRVQEHTVLWQQSNIIGPKQKKLLASPEPRSSCTKMLRGFLINVRFYADGLMSSRGQAGSPLQLNWLLFSQAHFLRVKGHNLDLFPRGASFFLIDHVFPVRYHKVLLCYISILFHLSEESGSNRVLMAFIQVRDVLAIHQEIFLYD